MKKKNAIALLVTAALAGLGLFLYVNRRKMR